MRSPALSLEPASSAALPADPEGKPARSLRILYHHRIAAADGMRVHVNEVVEALRARGHLVKVVGPSAAAERTARAGAAVGLERLAEALRRWLPAPLYEALELLYNIPVHRRLQAAVREFAPHVVYERYNLFLLAGLWLRRRGGPPMLLEVNAPLCDERAQLGQLALKPLGRRCEAALWRGADAVLPVTAVLARRIRQVRGPGQVHVIPNGADLARRPAPEIAVEARRRLGIEPDHIVLGFVGFVRAWHGVGWAIEELARLPARVHLVIVGDGPALAELRARAEALGLAGRVHLTGRAPHEEVPAYVQSFDVALQTGAAPYASPLKLFEYMAMARAILAPDQPNIREILTDGVNARLFRPGDEADFRAALVQLCSDGELRRRLGEAAQRTVEERPLTWANNAVRIEEVAEALLRSAACADRSARTGASLA